VGYFSNGEEGERYTAAVCARCAHLQTDEDSGTEGCPVIDAHLLFNYEQTDDVQCILSMFIPRTSLWNEVCTMFVAKDEEAKQSIEVIRERVRVANKEWERRLPHEDTPEATIEDIAALLREKRHD